MKYLKDYRKESVLAPLFKLLEACFELMVPIVMKNIIDIGIKKKDNRLIFHTHNTKSNAKHEFGGVGLNNVTKRLELIYGSDYSLDIKDEETTYDVTLDLPERHPEDFDGAKDQAITDNSYD